MKKILFLALLLTAFYSLAVFAASHPYDEQSKSLPKVAEDF